ncbi:MAG: TRAP transporter small permease [Dokdonella sp.]|uniref:TRAP transporter small permease n=1 Tax=Dokdonella sp. TaxID=2291710 RepID=UPI0025C6ADD3|nr:TRAP transporter small permease [Dokdonella sp.]MBX3701600.1 TRAP transporter small permease [Dokdonella sp.]MCW5578090.1 TRAP transporter small permease [Dokdonella sp.]
MSRLARPLLRWLDRLETGLIAVLVLAMVLLAGAQILLRNLFDTGLDWADPLLRAMVLWAAMLGALAAVRDDKHIGLDVLAHFVHGRIRRLIHFVTLLFSAGVSGLMAWHGYGLVMLDYGGNGRIAGIPSWLIEIIIPVGFGLIALRLLVHAFLPARNEAMPVLAPELP